MVLLSSLIFRHVRIKYQTSLSTAFCGALLVPFLYQFTAPYMTDPFVILYLFLLVQISERSAFLWLPTLFIGIGVNEKIPLIFAILSFLTLVQTRNRKTISHAAFSFLACLTYLGIRKALDFPGYENQTNPFTFIEGFSHSLQLCFTPKGVIRNFLPVGIMLLLALPDVFTNDEISDELKPPPLLFLSVIGMTLITLATDVQLNVGRNVMHLFPIFLPYFVIFCYSKFTREKQFGS